MRLDRLLTTSAMIGSCVALRATALRSASAFVIGPRWSAQRTLQGDRNGSIIVRSLQLSSLSKSSDEDAEPSTSSNSNVSKPSLTNPQRYAQPPAPFGHPKLTTSATTTTKRSFSSSRDDDDHWSVPKDLIIPEDRVELSFTRSSGAGGQNVNKVNTKVEIRFHVMDASWLPLEVRLRLASQQANRMNKEGYLSLQSQDYRTQVQNRKAVFSKLKDFVLQAYPRPKERKIRTGVSNATKARNKDEKRMRSQVKANRRKVDF